MTVFQFQDLSGQTVDWDDSSPERNPPNRNQLRDPMSGQQVEVDDGNPETGWPVSDMGDVAVQQSSSYPVVPARGDCAQCGHRQQEGRRVWCDRTGMTLEKSLSSCQPSAVR